MDLKRQYEKLLRYCYMKIGDKFIAEDIVQETFLKFWQSKSYEDTGKEMAYLYTIARNLCADEFRKKQTLNIDDYADLIVSESADIEKSIDGLEIERILNELPEQLREIITMRYVIEMSSSDIAKVMNMSRFSINRRLKEGLKMIKNKLEGGLTDDR